MEGRWGLKLRFGARPDLVWALGAAVVTGFVGLLLMAWVGGLVATQLLAALIKVLFWGFGFGWVGGARL
ncbi:MAG: hypothetical protein KGJ57_08995 [Sphingomonadales bacterium]|nr:hypothetical protein [Sphingomonadales bacterium]MDE2169547.1 hypothetical protein [Sphingomonadales bacterium]